MSEITSLEKYTRLADYLAAAQIFLKDNVCLEKSLKPEHIKPRLLGHWGTSPGINFVYAHINRLIKKHSERDFLYVVGTGHGFPAFQAGLFIEGSLSKFNQTIPYSKKGFEQVVYHFSTPYGFPSHLNPEAPGVILEGGELGYSLSNSYGSVLDEPNLVTVCLIGDGESETGPLSASWNANRFINPVTDGAVLPILHLNGYKISGPTIFGRMSDKEIKMFFESKGYDPIILDITKSKTPHKKAMEVFDKAMEKILLLQNIARATKAEIESPKWPVIIFRSLKGMGAPKYVGTRKIEGNCDAHQIVFDHDIHKKPKQIKQLESWLKSYKINELISFSNSGTLKLDQDIQSLIPSNTRKLGMSKYAHRGEVKFSLPDFDNLLDTSERYSKGEDSMRVMGKFLKKVFQKNKKTFRLFSPDETYSNHLDDVFSVTSRAWMWPIKEWDKDISRKGRVIEILSEHTLFGMLTGYTLTGRVGIFATYEAFATIVSSMIDQYVKFIKVARNVKFRNPVPALNIVLSSLLERQEHNGFSHQNPSFIANMLDHDYDLVNVYFPADKNIMLFSMKEALQKKNQVNIFAVGKKMKRVFLTPDEAEKQVKDGIMIWDFLSNQDPDIILATAGDYVTEEAIIGLKMFRSYFPDVKVRFVNILKFDTLRDEISLQKIEEVLTKSKPIIFNYHGYIASVRKILFGKIDAKRIKINGYRESGSTTTAFDMEARNGLSRYHVVIDLVKLGVSQGKINHNKANQTLALMRKLIKEEKEFIIKNFKDPDYISNFEL